MSGFRVEEKVSDLLASGRLSGQGASVRTLPRRVRESTSSGPGRRPHRPECRPRRRSLPTRISCATLDLLVTEPTKL
jgi:hypothetical protein